MKITPEGLKVLQSIEHYIFFSWKIGEAKSVKSLASDENREAFLAYIKYFIRGNRGFLGGFQISFLDEEMTRLTKQPHTFIDQKKGEDGNLVIDVERYQLNKISQLPQTAINDYKAALNYGNTKKK